MGEKEFLIRIKLKRDTNENWIINNPKLLNGEMIFVDMEDNNIRIKVGDGINNYNNLPFIDEKINNISFSDIKGILGIEQGGTGVSDMIGTDYNINRPRGIILQSSPPESVPNGCIVGVYE